MNKLSNGGSVSGNNTKVESHVTNCRIYSRPDERLVIIGYQCRALESVYPVEFLRCSIDRYYPRCLQVDIRFKLSNDKVVEVNMIDLPDDNMPMLSKMIYKRLSNIMGFVVSEKDTPQVRYIA